MSADLGTQLRRAQVGDCAARELLADDRRALEDGPLAGFEPVEPLGEECLDRRRHDEVARLRQRRQLLDVERVALGRAQHALAGRIVELGAEPGEQLLRILRRQRFERHDLRAGARCGPARPPVEQLRPRQAEHEHGRALDAAVQVVEQVEEGRLAAVDVLEDEQQRALRRKHFDEPPSAPEQLVDGAPLGRSGHVRESGRRYR